MNIFISLSYLKTFLSTVLLSTVMLGFLATSAAAMENSTPSSKDTPAAIENTVNINHATAIDIAVMLKGIGLKKAEAIVEWRIANGKFTDIDQLTEVKGIGEKTLLINKGKISL